MKDLFTLMNCPRWLRQDIREYWAEKERRFERLLAGFRPESRRLRLAVRRSKVGWNAKAVLTLNSRTLVGRKEASGWYEALDEAADRLASEIRRYKERLQAGERRFGRYPFMARGWQSAS